MLASTAGNIYLFKDISGGAMTGSGNTSTIMTPAVTYWLYEEP